MADPTLDRTCDQGCNGCDDCTDWEPEEDCPHCNGDGMDPWSDDALPCPACDGSGRHG